MKRIALLLVASLLGSIAILPAAETSVPTRTISSKSNYRKGKKAHRSKVRYKKAKHKAQRRNVIN